MKKLLCFLLCSVLIFSSISLCFAQDWSSTDSQNLQNTASRLYYMNQSAAYYLYNIAQNTNNIYNKTVDIYNALFNNGHNITYWVQSISTWMSPIYNAVIKTPLDLEKIYYSLGYTTDVDGDGNLEYHPYLNFLNNNGWGNSTATQAIYTMGWDGTISTYSFTPSDNWQQNLMFMYQFMNNNLTQAFAGVNYQLHSDKWGIASLLSPETLQESRPTYNSTDHMLELYLQNIGVSSSRLAYVLASDERIEAQEAAAANEDAVVDNFIDSTGDGATSPSDIGSVSDLSSGYKQNFGTDASPSGIFDIFNSDHATWFSQETKNQLDTTTPTRLSKGSESETPLLDKQIEDIYDALGVKQP